MRKIVKRITGRLTQEPKPLLLPSGGQVINNSIVVNSGKKPLFFNIEVWGESLIKTFAAFHKGYKIQVMGEIKINKWKDKDNGEPKEREVINVKNVMPAAPSVEELTWVIGRLVKSPESQEYDNKTVFDFILALNHKKKKTEFLNAEYWVFTDHLNQEFLDQFTKGSKVEIFGRIKNANYTNNQKEITKESLVVEKISLLEYYAGKEPLEVDQGYVMPTPDVSAIAPPRKSSEKINF